MILALDVGQKIVGVARSDSEEGFVFPVGSYARAQNNALTAILSLVDAEKPRALVVGIPLDHVGKDTEQAADIRRFCERISKRNPVPIFFEDESYSTEDVIELLQLKSEEAYREAKKEGKVDAAAATVILQRYLARNKK